MGPGYFFSCDGRVIKGSEMSSTADQSQHMPGSSPLPKLCVRRQIPFKCQVPQVATICPIFDIGKMCWCLGITSLLSVILGLQEKFKQVWQQAAHTGI